MASVLDLAPPTYSELKALESNYVALPQAQRVAVKAQDMQRINLEIERTFGKSPGFIDSVMPNKNGVSWDQKTELLRSRLQAEHDTAFPHIRWTHRDFIPSYGFAADTPSPPDTAVNYQPMFMPVLLGFLVLTLALCNLLFKHLKTVSKAWQKITSEVAQDMPLYGIGGWLIFFSVSLIFGMLVSLGSVSKFFGDIGFPELTVWHVMSFQMPILYWLGACLWAELIARVLIFRLMLKKSSSFRPAVITYLIASGIIGLGVGVIAAIYRAEGMSSIFNADLWIRSFITWVLSLVIWIPYFTFSKRVRLTFESVIKSRKNSQMNHAELEAAVQQKATKNMLDDSNDDAIWTQALNEANDAAQRQSSLWAKCFSLAEGDENKAKARYMTQRVEALKTEKASKKYNQEKELQSIQHSNAIEARLAAANQVKS
jgi:Protein of unknown function (DUF2569)